MRVLTVGNLYPPHHFGGYEQVWKSAVDHLRARGNDVRVLATDFRHPGVPDPDEPHVDRGLRWYWRDHDFARFSLPERVRIERRNHALLAHHMTELRPDVVSFWSMGGMSHSLIEDVRARGLPIVSFVHDQWFDYGRFTDQWLRLFYAPRRAPVARAVQWFTALPTRLDYGAAGRYVFVSDFIRRRALELPLGLRDTDVAPSGIDPLFLDLGEPHDWHWRILHVGRLHPDKGIHDAVAALTHLPLEATLTFAGSWDPRDEDSLDGLIGRLGLRERVTMLGRLPPQEIAELYRSHDALLFPVRWDEPWGLVPIEAMGCGCPVIATGRGGSGEYLRDGDNCLIVPAEDAPALAAAVAQLAGDPDLRARLRAGGAETAPRHTVDVFNAAVEHHLRAAAGGGSRQPQPDARYLAPL